MGTPDKRFPNLIDVVKSWMPWRNEPTDISRDFWMPDDSCMVCYDCDAQFTTFNRRHHCRKCGRVFCARCTAHSIPVKSNGKRTFSEEGERIRVCNYCFKQWAEDVAAACNGIQSSTPVLSRSPSSASLTSTKSNGTGNSSTLTTVSFPNLNGAHQCAPCCYGSSSNQTIQIEACPYKHESSKLVTNLDAMTNVGGDYPDHLRFCYNRSDDDDEEYGTCRSDSELQGMLKPDVYYGPNVFGDVDKNHESNSTHSAEAHADLIVSNPLVHGNSEANSSFVVDKKEEHNLEKCDGCDASSPKYSLNSADAESMEFENDRQLWFPPEPEDDEEENESVLFDDEEDATGEWRDLRLSSSFGSGECRNKERLGEEHKKAMRNIIDGHFRALVAQLLDVENLPLGHGKENWLDIITSLSWEAASLLKPDMSNGGGMDPGLYVKVKCLAYGRPSDSTLVKGVVCKKNVAHRRMTTKVEKARLLLLGGALEYQRVTNHLSSFDTLLQQEMDHLRMAVAKIDAHHPNVLLVEKSVSRFAQECLLGKNISLVLNVKRTLLERVARCTGAQIVPSIDHLSSTKLGQCEMFRVEKFFEEHDNSVQGGKKLLKTLMFFEGCPKPLGYTILLKGTNNDALMKIKHVVQYGVFAAYHLALETSFLADEGASLPELPLKSPITIAIPDKPSSLNRSITMIPGFKVSTSEIPYSDGSLGSSTVSYPNYEFGDQQKAEKVMSPYLFDKHDDQSSDSVSTLLVQSDEVRGYPSGNTDLLGQDAKQTIAPILYLSPSGELSNCSSDSHYCNRKVDNKTSILGDDQTNCTFNHAVNDIVPSTSLENLEILETGTTSNVARLSNRKLLQSQQVASDFRSSYHDNAGDILTLQKEEFPPSPSDHQSILVSLSSRCVWKGTVCERAHLFRIKYYGSFDKPLGRYLRDHLFDQSYRCHSCEMPSDAHIYCYTHRQGSLTISVRKFHEFLLPGERDGKIWMWHRCLRCPRVNGFPPATRRVVMSDAAWGLSFGKFLELSFSNHAAANRVASCGHSLHRDCLRFYGCGNMVACFRYAPINLHSVYLPPSKLDFNYKHQDWVQKEAEELVDDAELLFTEVLNLLHQCAEGKSNSASPDDNGKIVELRRNILHLEGLLQAEKTEFEGSFEKIMKKEEIKGKPIIDILEINKLRRQLLFQSYVWDKRILSSMLSYNISEELPSGVTKRKKENSPSNLRRTITSIDSTSKVAHPFNLSAISSDIQGRLDASQQTGGVEYDQINGIDSKVSPITSTIANQVNYSEPGPVVRRVLSDGQFQKMVDLSDTLDAKWQGESGGAVSDSGKLKTSASENSDELSGADVIQPFASASQAKVTENIEEWMKTSTSDLYRSYYKKSGYLTQLLNDDHSNHVLFKKLQRQSAGKLLLPLGANDIVIPLYDDEPTSIICYALVCPDYQSQISDEPERSRDGKESSLASAFEDLVNIYGLQSGDDLSLESLKSFESFDENISSMTSSKSSLVVDPLTSTKSMHVKVSFSDNGKVKYSVTSYYAKCFDALRRTCCPLEHDFIRSISRCKKWGAQGGKSNVFFAKSLDDRFIIKQVTKTELESFIKFAPEYFKYLSESISTGSPTCLAKILGIYQVTIKYSSGGKESKIDVLVMENLLFGRQITRLYDLKGSSRSRYNADSSGNNKVLLDQNLIEAMPTSPIFVGNKAKRLLERAVWNDTSFLASIDVMDYSLLVGIDEEKHELVLGIIDFMRQYTWDKHLETWVKASGILGGPKNESPTVISPKQYKKRFRKAMSAYFLVVPDQWSPPTIIPSNSDSSYHQQETLDASEP